MERREEIFSAVAVAMLLLLTAWGNALAMMIVSAAGLLIGLVFIKGRPPRGAMLAAIVGCVVAISVSIVLLLLRRGR